LDRGIDYFGVDISDIAIDIATKSYPSAIFTCDDIGKLNLELHFDLVLERTVFIHLVRDEQWFNALKTVKTHLKKMRSLLLMTQSHSRWSNLRRS
jgi:hypothetical protein